MGISFDFNEIHNKLEELDKRVSNEIGKNALEKGSNIILEAQTESVPVRKGTEGGKLKRSLDKSSIKGTGYKKKIQIGIENAKEREVLYGYYQEYGTSSMIGKKWMKRAFQKSIKNANEEIKNSIIEDLSNI